MEKVLVLRRELGLVWEGEWGLVLPKVWALD